MGCVTAGQADAAVARAAGIFFFSKLGVPVDPRKMNPSNQFAQKESKC